MNIVSKSLTLVIGEAGKEDVMADDLEAGVSVVMGSIGQYYYMSNILLINTLYLDIH